jgi:ATP-dependent RNA helicase DDX47/RRP3
MEGFQELGIPNALCKALNDIGWEKPTEIQRKSIPHALDRKDIIALAETGSGKTGAFALPILTFLLTAPSRYFAVVMAPTRELAIQINEVFEALGVGVGLLTVCLVGGISLVDQAIQLAKGPHVIVCTPGRIIDHLQNTKGFSLRNVKVVVLDEADRLISMDFEKEIDQFFAVVPANRNTYLFSATMTSKVNKLKRNFLIDPVSISVSQNFQTPKVGNIISVFN